MTISVIGNGLVGSVIAKDLSLLHKVKVFDININDKHENLEYINFNILTDNLDVLNKSDLILLAVPGSIGFDSLKRIIPLGKNIVDISFFPEKASELNNLAKENNISVIVDCGVAPGLCNMFLGHHYNSEEVIEYKCYVGGLPFERKLPWQYKAPFSPTDVLEEYTRPVYIRENGLEKIVEPMSGNEYIDIESVGTLEAFYTDGLRSLLESYPNIPNLSEKTLRYPGYIDKIKFLKETGFLSSEKIKVNDINISPLELTSQLLIKDWELGDDMEFTAMNVEISTKSYNYIYKLFDNKDITTGFSSMARTTGFTANAVINLFNDNLISEKGIIFPEKIGENGKLFKSVLDYLEERSIYIEIYKR